MTYEEAIKILSEELHHTEFHLQDENKAPEYYEEMRRFCEALNLAIDSMTYRAEVKKYGSELGMAIAHKEECEAKQKELDAKWEETKKKYPSLAGEKGDHQ